MVQVCDVEKIVAFQRNEDRCRTDETNRGKDSKERSKEPQKQERRIKARGLMKKEIEEEGEKSKDKERVEKKHKNRKREGTLVIVLLSRGERPDTSKVGRRSSFSKSWSHTTRLPISVLLLLRQNTRTKEKEGKE